MKIDPKAWFGDTFKDLTGNSPFPWQEDFFNRLLAGNLPGNCDIPTGLGKTSVIAVWLLALGYSLLSQNTLSKIPRRLVYVVNRRTVVDQATTVVESMATALETARTQQLKQITDVLTGLSVLPPSLNNDAPLAISTLRGQLADNEAWKQNPARPAVIIGTVDMIGSKLLFSGYGDGRWKRSFHAGLLGQDTLFVHDEAHLSPAFGKLLRGIKALQGHNGRSLKEFFVMEMSATIGLSSESAISITDKDRSHKEVKKRLESKKFLHIQEINLGEILEETIANRALQHKSTGQSVLIYVQKPSQAVKVAGLLRASMKPAQVCVLTGTMRGYERDQLVNDPVFQRFLSDYPSSNNEESCFLVSTSAGEVGVDLDADIGVLDLTTLDSFIQRAGRIGRTGGRETNLSLIIDPGELKLEKVKYEVEKDHIRRLAKTLELLYTLPSAEDGLSVSPLALSELAQHPEYDQAVQPLPRMRSLDSYLLDTWSMTGLDRRVGHPVAPWLHGIIENVISDTWLVWRKGIPTINSREKLEKKIANRILQHDSLLERWSEAYPVLGRERARLPYTKVREFINKIIKQLDKPEKDLEETPDTRFRAILMTVDNTICEVWLNEIDQWASELEYATLIFNAELGGLVDGLPDHTSAGNTVADVADELGVRERWQIESSENGWQAVYIGDNHEIASLQLEAEGFSEAVNELQNTRDLQVVPAFIQKEAEEEENKTQSGTVYLVQRTPRVPDDQDYASITVKKQLLEEHLPRVGKAARDLGGALGLSKDIVEVVGMAGDFHDFGKDRKWWQLSKGNYTDKVYAKYYANSANWRINGGYRHELGSLLEMNNNNELRDHSLRELILHLISAHHGYARPDFPERAYDRKYSLDTNQKAVQETQLRFEKLQRTYGWWGLAYLEAVLKTADAIGS